VEYSKWVQIGKGAAMLIVFLTCAGAHIAGRDLPPEMLGYALAALGLSDTAYMIKSAVENKSKIETGAAYGGEQ